MFSNSQSPLDTFSGEQIPHFLHVNLQHAELDLVRYLSPFLGVDSLEQVLAELGNYP